MQSLHPMSPSSLLLTLLRLLDLASFKTLSPFPHKTPANLSSCSLNLHVIFMSSE